jgi:hypothetical protein
MEPAHDCRKEGQEAPPAPPVLAAEEPLPLLCPPVEAWDVFPGGHDL